MSGEIFHPIENIEGMNVSRWNPLMCSLCNEKYEDPCILSCYHSFCSRCLRGRAVESKMSCPLCCVTTSLRENESLPPPDKLMNFLVTSSTEEKELCANCDKTDDPMFFCNTCAQPLCCACKDDTHRAKMFSRHDIVLLAKRTKEIHRVCPHHHEPYILFSTEKKVMLCINCFRDMKIESRSFCVDIETAYNQSCTKLHQCTEAIQEMQNSVRDSLLLLKELLNEININSEKEKSSIEELFNKIQSEISQKKDDLLAEVDRQYQDKEQLFKKELATLTTLLPTLHTQLVTCSAFSSSANKFEFLDLVFVLMSRLKAIIHHGHPINPSQGSQICTDFKTQFARCLEPLLFPLRNTGCLPTSTAGTLTLGVPTTSPQRIDIAGTNSMVNIRPGNGNQFTYSQTIVQNGRRLNILNKVKLVESRSVFVDHCKDFENTHKELSSAVEKLKSQLQELQRDLTMRRCLTKSSAVAEMQQQIIDMEENLQQHKMAVEQKQPLLEKHWEESVQKIANEQEIYQVQLQDIVRLNTETGHLQTILNQLKRFVTSINAVTEKLAPKLASSCKETDHDSNIAALLEKINTIEVDSQLRVDAIKTAEEVRETHNAAHRANPLDKELIHMKGMLKAPSARQHPRESGKRSSKELKVDDALDSIADKVFHEDDLIPENQKPTETVADKTSEHKKSSKGDTQDLMSENMENCPPSDKPESKHPKVIRRNPAVCSKNDPLSTLPSVSLSPTLMKQAAGNISDPLPSKLLSSDPVPKTAVASKKKSNEKETDNPPTKSMQVENIQEPSITVTISNGVHEGSPVKSGDVNSEGSPDMTGGESLKARIDKLRDSLLDNSVSTTVRSRSPRESYVDEATMAEVSPKSELSPQSPKQNVDVGSRSRRRTRPISENN